MPIIPAYRNEVVNTRDDASLLGKVELDLSPGRNTRDFTFDVKLLRVNLDDGFQVEWSQDGKKRIFPVNDDHGKGIDLTTAIADGLASVIEVGGDVSSEKSPRHGASEGV
jgi:hypothetical protein